MPSTASIPAPYPGLRSFRGEEAAIFCGRTAHRAQLLKALEKSRFLAVVGASGSGKSSLVRAGLLPDIRNGLFRGVDPDQGRSVTITPGLQPFTELAGGLASKKLSAAEAEVMLRRGPLGVAQVLDRADFTPCDFLVIVVDQFEEIFHFAELSKDELARRQGKRAAEKLLDGTDNEAQAFISLLLETSRQVRHQVYVVLTMRSEYLGSCDRFVGLPEAISRSQFLTPRLNRSQLEQAITLPLELCGMAIQPELTNLILNQITANQDQLPLLQHALVRTWKRAARRTDKPVTLTIEDYLAIGGLANAIDQHADEICRKLQEDRGIGEQSVQRFFRVFGRHDIAGQPPVRRAVRKDQVKKETGLSDEVVDELANTFRADDVNFLVPSVQKREVLDDDTRLDISHESLLRQWTKLAGWMSVEWNQRQILQNLAQSMTDWERTAPPPTNPLRRFWRFELAGEAVTTPLYEQTNHELLASADAPGNLSAWAARYNVEWPRLEAFRRQAFFWKRLSPAIGMLGVALLVLTVLLGIAYFYARKQQNSAVSLAYRSQIGLTQSEWSAGRAAAAEEILAHTSNTPGLRGWEYNYWLARFKSNQQDFAGFTKRASEVAFTSDGKSLAGGSEDGSVIVWDAATRTVLHSIRASARPIWAVAISPDDTKIASAGEDGVLHLWDTKTGNEIPPARRHDSCVRSVAFSPDGAHLAAATLDGRVRVWQTLDDHFEDLPSPDAPTGAVYTVRYSSDGKQIAYGGEDFRIHVWDVDARRYSASLAGHKGAVYSVAFHPDPAKALLISGSYDGTIKVWPIASGQELMTLNGHNGPVWTVGYDRKGARFVSGSHDNTIRVWETQTGLSIFRLIGHTAGVWSAVFDPTDNTRIASGASDARVILWNASTRQENMTFEGHDRRINRVCSRPDGKRVATASEDGTVRVWDADSGQQIAVSDKQSASVLAVAYSPDGQTILSGGADGTVRVWDGELKTAPLILTEHTDAVNWVTFSKDGDFFASASSDRTVKLWDAHRVGRSRQTLVGHTEQVLSVAIHPDGKHLISGSGFWDAQKNRWNLGEVRLWDLTHDSPRSVGIGKGFGPFWCLDYSPSGDFFVATSGNYDASICHARTGLAWTLFGDKTMLVHSLIGHRSEVRGAAYLDETRLITAGQDGTLKVWDTNTGNCTMTLRGHSAPVLSVSATRGGTRVFSGGEDALAKQWCPPSFSP